MQRIERKRDIRGACRVRYGGSSKFALVAKGRRSGGRERRRRKAAARSRHEGEDSGIAATTWLLGRRAQVKTCATWQRPEKQKGPPAWSEGLSD